MVNNNGTLAVSFGGTGTWTLADVDTLRAKAIFNDGGSLGFNVTDPSGSAIYGGTISGNMGLAKVGLGLLVLSSPQSYTGPTTVNAGILVFDGGDNSLPANSPIRIGSGASLLFNQNQTITSLSSFTSYGYNSNNYFPIFPGINIAQGKTLTIDNSTNLTYAGNFNGLNCQIIKQGSGTLSVGGFGQRLRRHHNHQRRRHTSRRSQSGNYRQQQPHHLQRTRE